MRLLIGRSTCSSPAPTSSGQKALRSPQSRLLPLTSPPSYLPIQHALSTRQHPSDSQLHLPHQQAQSSCPLPPPIMYPLGFNDFSDSPVIILSPHQHQFDPISRAAHTLYRPTTKPILPSKPWDRPIMEFGHAQKRSRDEISRSTNDPAQGKPFLPTTSPMVSPPQSSDYH